jgi:hypothetical protein
VFIRSLIFLTCSGFAVAAPYGPATVIPDAAAPTLVASGQATVTRMATMPFQGAQALLTVQPQLDRLVIHPLGPGGPPPSVIDADLRGGSALAVMDWNDDGFPDIIAASRWRRELYGYLHDGQHGFLPRQTLATGLDSVTCLVAARIKGTLRRDLVGITDHDGKLFLLPATNGGLGPAETLFRASAPLHALAAADLNGDGLDDLVIAHGPQILTLLNEPAGGFGPATAVDFHARELSVEDLDGDGRPDLLAVHHDSGEVGWFPGLAGGGWGELFVLSARARDGFIADLNQDGLAEIVFAAAPGGDLMWLENSGSQTFASPKTAVPHHAAVLVAVDADGDGHRDLIAADPRHSELLAFPSLAGRPYERWASDFPLGDRSGPSEDANGDGRSNLLAYALGRHPLDGSGLRFLTRSEEGWFFEFPMRAASPPHGLTYQVETSGDLKQWTVDDSPLMLEPIQPGWLRARLPVTISAAEPRFTRLRIFYQDP